MIRAPLSAAEANRCHVRPPRIFVDLDGVVVDFRGFMTAHGLSGDQVKAMPGAYREMAALPGAIAALRALIGMGFEVWIASKPPTSIAFAYGDKAHWVIEQIPELKRRIVLTHEKGFLGNARDYLVDDRPHKARCEEFVGTLVGFVDGFGWPQALEFFRARRPNQ